MIDIKQAVASARQFASEELTVKELLLEEVSSDDRHFHITLSFPHRLGGLTNPPPIFGRYQSREFKTFDVDRESGHVAAMSIREVG